MHRHRDVVHLLIRRGAAVDTVPPRVATRNACSSGASSSGVSRHQRLHSPLSQMGHSPLSMQRQLSAEYCGVMAPVEEARRVREAREALERLESEFWGGC